MRLIVLIEWGPRRWHKTIVEPGQTLRVGRFERADLTVSHDEKMSGLHFELRWDGASCTAYDLGSAEGTYLDGEKVTTGRVDHGGWIQAGDTVFSVYHEGRAATPPEEIEEEDDDERPPRVEVSRANKANALSMLRAETVPLYVVLDAARNRRILELLRVAPDQARSLYDGVEGEALEQVAPYLAAVPKDGWLLERLIEEGWGQGWGIYLLSSRPFTEVRQHLRRLLIVEDVNTRDTLYFRFYDPVVLSATVPLCTPRQVQMLFGDNVVAFFVERYDAVPLRLVVTGDAGPA